MPKQNKLLQAALYYAEKLGMSIIPIQSNKKPYFPWEPFQKDRASSGQITAWWGHYPNAMIGMVTGEISDLVVIDLDIITEEADHLLHELIPQIDQAPITSTPKGGRHFFFKHPGIQVENNSRIIQGADFRGDGGYVILPPSKNIEGKYYKWVNSILHFTPQSLPQAYIDYVKNAKKENPIIQRELFKEGTRDEDLFHVANTLIRGGMGEQSARLILSRLASQCDPPFPQRETDIKINSALQRAARRDRNISEEARFWIENIDGYFDVNDFYRDAGITAPEQKGAAIMAFQRMVDDGVLEKHGMRRGVYRLVESKCTDIDFVNASDLTIPVIWPLEVEKWVSMYPKNIAIIAGEKDAGKTALFLNFVRLNMDKYKIHYFSSEMGAIEFRVRLSKFANIGLRDWTFYPKERASKFEDVIQPNDINIIDFLEIYDEFYKIGFYIKQIFDKLNNGIAIIGIQKNPKTDYGLGGLRSIEKARLYMAIGGHELKIVSGKNWVTQVNPVGLIRNFKLVDGCKFIPTTEWERR